MFRFPCEFELAGFSCKIFLRYFLTLSLNDVFGFTPYLNIFTSDKNFITILVHSAGQFVQIR